MTEAEEGGTRERRERESVCVCVDVKTAGKEWRRQGCVERKENIGYIQLCEVGWMRR